MIRIPLATYCFSLRLIPARSAGGSLWLILFTSLVYADWTSQAYQQGKQTFDGGSGDTTSRRAPSAPSYSPSPYENQPSYSQAPTPKDDLKKPSEPEREGGYNRLNGETAPPSSWLPVVILLSVVILFAVFIGLIILFL